VTVPQTADYQHLLMAINNINWNNASTAWISGAGASGVTFVRMNDVATFVLKGSSQVAEEYVIIPSIHTATLHASQRAHCVYTHFHVIESSVLASLRQ
jgi:hypothetical protein